MKRRDFSTWCGTSVGAIAALGAGRVLAQAGKPQAGTDYKVLDKVLPGDAPAGKIEVVEFFRYTCPHCFTFEPQFEAWIKRLPKDVSLRRAPVAFGDESGILQRLYFSLDAMSLLGTLHVKVFNAIHVERLPLNSADAIVAWVAKQGVDKAKFQEHYKSFSVATKASRSTQAQNDFRIEGVPTIGIAGRFITDGPMARSMERALVVTDYLIGEVRAKRVA